jgi:hypothetical protein
LNDPTFSIFWALRENQYRSFQPGLVRLDSGKVGEAIENGIFRQTAGLRNPWPRQLVTTETIETEAKSARGRAPTPKPAAASICLAFFKIKGTAKGDCWQ